MSTNSRLRPDSVTCVRGIIPLKIFKSSNAHFFVSRVEKRYLLATKIFDTLFDSGENAAVAWHHYNVRPLRIILAFKVASIVDYETAHLFWYCLTERNQKKAYARLPEVCEMLMRNVGNLPDARSREIVMEALTWARDHPESIHIHTDRKIVLQGHFPNMVAFSNLLQGLEDFSTRWNRDVRRITHDRQSEFDKTLASWHAMFSNASPEEFRWAGETHKIQKVAGSHFEVKADSDSPGIQAIDVVLWLYSRFKRGDEIPSDCARLLNYVFRRGWESDFSFKGVSAQVEAKWSSILYGPMSDEQAEKARELQSIFEQRRLESIRQYSEDGVVPFMRNAEAKLIKPG